jgi:flagellar biosynthesis GTPase FlhF
MSFIPQDLVQKRMAEIMYERENAKRLEEERRIQAEINAEAHRLLIEAELAEKRKVAEEKRIQMEIEAEARRKIIEAELAERRRLEEERLIQAEIERAAIANIVEMKREEIRQKQEEIEFYRQEIIRVQTEICKMNGEIMSFNHTPSCPRIIPSDDEYDVSGPWMGEINQSTTKKTWKGNEYEVDNSDECISKINTLNGSLSKIIAVFRENGKLTLHKLKECVNSNDHVAKVVRDGNNNMPLSKIIQDKMKVLIDMNILKVHE